MPLDARAGNVISALVNRRSRVNIVPRPIRSFTMLAGTVLMVAGCAGNPETAAREGALAQQQLDAGNLRAAEATIAKAIAERDDLPALHLLRGRIEIAAGNMSAAFQAYESALGLDPANPEALQGVAQLGMRIGNLDRSQQAAEQILSLQPDQIDALLIKGVIQLVRNKHADAQATAQRVLTLDPANESATILMARSQFLQGQPDRALATVRAREKAGTRTEALALTELELLREARDAAGMLEVFTFLRTVRKDVDLALDEANVRYKLGDNAGARAVLVAALTSGRPSPAQVAAVTDLWREYDPTPLAPPEVARLRSASPDTRLALARFYLASSEPLVAEQLTTGLASSDADGVRARIAAARGDNANATRLADSVLHDDETQCDALIGRAFASLGEGHGERAILDGQRATAECPGWPAATYPVVAAYKHRSDAVGVQRTYADAVSRLPQDGELSRAFWSWLESRGRIREAVAEARRLTRKAPALTSGWRAYLAVCDRHPKAGCAGEADAGLAKSLKTYAVDLAPGAGPPRGLIGRLATQ